MRRLLCLHLTLLLMAATASQPSLAQPDYEETPPSEYVAQIVIPVDRVRATIKKPRPRIHLAKIHQPGARLFLDDDDTDYYDEAPDLQVGYRRPELVGQSATVDLPDDIKLRLAIARIKALAAYQKTWA